MNTVLSRIIFNTLWLAVCVAMGTFLLGVSLAWLTIFCEFPGRRWMEWGMMLPLAMPTYVLGFVWISLMDYSGVMPSYLREQFHFDITSIFPIRSRAGIISVMTLALYPYVYLLSRNAFLTQSRSMVEAGRSMGMNYFQVLSRISLPMARPWIVGGLMLVIMETLADFGTVSVFNYETFTTAIYKAWFSMFSLPAAAQLSSILVVMIFLLFWAEHSVRGRRGYSQGNVPRPTLKRFPLRGFKGWAITSFAVGILFLAFFIPLGQLLWWTYEILKLNFDSRYLYFLLHTVVLASLAAFLTVSLAIALSYANRIKPSALNRFATQISLMGYAVPGTVLAVGVFASLFWMDRQLIKISELFFSYKIGMLFTGTIFAMLLAYTVRFLAVGYQPVQNAMLRITPHVEEAARGLGLKGVGLLQRIHVPMIRHGLVTAAILVFVDVMKEMPITLMTRPFGWDTLSVKIFELTTEGQWQKAAFPSVVLVLTGLIAVLLLTQRKQAFEEVL